MWVAIVLACSAAIVVAQQDLLVSTSLGKVQGHYNEAGIKEWKGIRYAKAPMGNLRWEYPQSPDASSQVFNANFDAPGCPQLCKLPPGNCPSYGQSEDCLFLTVMAPSKPSADPNGYPVLFWVHGGAFEQGLGNCALYNGTTFAQSDVVTVVINYRLGALGFMASKSMQGNYGFMDQRMALQWTQDNIAGFGGNPNNVAMAGQSAGAMSVSLHLTSPKSKGLFQKGIMESNPFGMPYHSRESAGKNADGMMAYVQCGADDVACMRTKSVDEILAAQKGSVKLDAKTLFINFLPFAPMVEVGGEIPEQPLNAMMKGNMQAVPLLSGSMYDEGQLFVNELFTAPMSKIAYKSTVDVVFGKAGPQILEKYPFDLIPGNTDGRDIFNIVATDLLFYCPLRNITRGYQAHLGSNSTPTYIYRFKHVISFDCWGPDYTFCVGSVCHGSELPFVFNVFNDGTIFYTPTPQETALAADLGHAWTNFMTKGDPNVGLSLPAGGKYPLYDAVSDQLVVLDEPDASLQAHVRDSYCELWDSIGFFW